MPVIDGSTKAVKHGATNIAAVYYGSAKIWPKVTVYTQSPTTIQEINEPYDATIIAGPTLYNGILLPPFILKDNGGTDVVAPYLDGTVKWFSAVDGTTGVGGALFVASHGKWHGIVRLPMGGTNALDAADSPAFWGVRFQSDGYSCADFTGFEWTKQFVLLIMNNGTATVCADPGMSMRGIPPVLNLPAGMAATDLQNGDALT
jgi:hypothetical protein